MFKATIYGKIMLNALNAIQHPVILNNNFSEAS
jgi:hypothetical protein